MRAAYCASTGTALVFRGEGILTGSVKDPENAVDRRAREDARFASGREGAPRKRISAAAIALRERGLKRRAR